MAKVVIGCRLAGIGVAQGWKKAGLLVSASIPQNGLLLVNLCSNICSNICIRHQADKAGP